MKALVTRLAALLVIGSATIAGAPASANDPWGPVLGKKAGEWTASWWQWAFAQGFVKGDAFQPGEIDCAVGQSGRVWFLAGIGGNTDNPGGPQDADRICRDPLPAGTRLFFPLINIVLGTPDPLCPPGSLDADNPGHCTVREKRQVTDALLTELKTDVLNSTACRLRAELDGVPVHMLGTPIVRVQSPPFFIPEVEGFVLAEDPKAISDGFWVMLPPLARGKHTLFISGGLCDETEPTNPDKTIFANDVTYEFEVR